ncbi:hypothetical protein ACF3NS_00375 [Arsenicicoccus cauae]
MSVATPVALAGWSASDMTEVLTSSTSVSPGGRRGDGAGTPT